MLAISFYVLYAAWLLLRFQASQALFDKKIQLDEMDGESLSE